MNKLMAAILIAFGLAWPQFAKAGPNEDAVAVRAKWEQLYNSGDADKLVAFYTKDATRFGSGAQLFSRSQGVRTYFSKLPPGIQTTMGDQQAIAVGPDVILSSRLCEFHPERRHRDPLPFDTRDREGGRPMADRSAPWLAGAEMRP